MMSRRIRSFCLPLATGALILAALTFGTGPVAAHTTEVRQGDDYAVTSASHASGYVCDREADGHAVVAEWFSGLSGQIFATASDTTDAGCSARVGFEGRLAAEVRVCE